MRLAPLSWRWQGKSPDPRSFASVRSIRAFALLGKDCFSIALTSFLDSKLWRSGSVKGLVWFRGLDRPTPHASCIGARLGRRAGQLSVPLVDFFDLRTAIEHSWESVLLPPDRLQGEGFSLCREGYRLVSRQKKASCSGSFSTASSVALKNLSVAAHCLSVTCSILTSP